MHFDLIFSKFLILHLCYYFNQMTRKPAAMMPQALQQFLIFFGSGIAPFWKQSAEVIPVADGHHFIFIKGYSQNGRCFIIFFHAYNLLSVFPLIRRTEHSIHLECFLQWYRYTPWYRLQE